MLVLVDANTFNDYVNSLPEESVREDDYQKGHSYYPLYHYLDKDENIVAIAMVKQEKYWISSDVLRELGK